MFILSFLLPAGKKNESEDSASISEEAIKEMVGREVEGARTQISDIVDETISYAMERTERSMERMTNEKMMAVNEYSDTVLEQINKNHNEVVFLYDMLNDKHENLKTTVSEATKKAGEVRQTLQDAEVTAKEVEEKVKEAREKAKAAEAKARDAEEKTKSAEDKRNEPEFIPIFPERVEVLHELPVEAEEKEEPKMQVVMEEAQPESKKSARKPKASEKVKNEMPLKEVQEVEELLDVVEENDKKNNNARILELHKAGKSNMTIAKELGLGILDFSGTS